MAYELFTRKRTHGGPPSVTITKSGNFIINSSALEKHILPNGYIHVYWDKESGKVGLKPLSKKVDKAYHINLSPKGNVGAFSGASFLSYIGFERKETTAFPATWNEKEGVLEFTIFDKPRRSPRG
jgi:hypothetical protein